MIATQEKVLSMCIILRKNGSRTIIAGGTIPKTIASAKIQVTYNPRETPLSLTGRELTQNQITPISMRKFAEGSK